MILISACLLGCACRYDGKSKPHPLAQELARRGLVIPVCPEQLGGLPTPRAPSEQQNDRVISADGTDVTTQYRRGAEEALRLAALYGCTTAVLKERSPSCGSGQIYDGSFTGTLTDGGSTASAWWARAGWRSFSGSWTPQNKEQTPQGARRWVRPL